MEIIPIPVPFPSVSPLKPLPRGITTNQVKILDGQIEGEAGTEGTKRLRIEGEAPNQGRFAPEN